MKLKIALFLLLLAVIGVSVWFWNNDSIVVLNPKGLIGLQQKKLIWTATWLMCIVVVPVFFMLGFFAWRYRASNQKAKYAPDWAHSHLAEILWWGVPCVIIAFLAVITWTSSHRLDPFKPLQSEKKPLVIQVVALDWKWLFIYPEEQIATVNFVQFPENVPVNFEITADAPMNSFWIPQLGGQIYAMAAMKTKLHLIANETGTFRGCSANISGEGFSGMVFTAKASTQAEFDAWVQSVQGSNALGWDEYTELAKQSSYNPVVTYRLGEPGLFDKIMMKYM